MHTRLKTVKKLSGTDSNLACLAMYVILHTHPASKMKGMITN